MAGTSFVMAGPLFITAGTSFVMAGPLFITDGTSFVMAGLGPAIHDFPLVPGQVVDARPKGGHDEVRSRPEAKEDQRA
jgi:hypothetical protein